MPFCIVCLLHTLLSESKSHFSGRTGHLRFLKSWSKLSTEESRREGKASKEDKKNISFKRNFFVRWLIFWSSGSRSDLGAFVRPHCLIWFDLVFAVFIYFGIFDCVSFIETSFSSPPILYTHNTTDSERERESSILGLTFCNQSLFIIASKKCLPWLGWMQSLE